MNGLQSYYLGFAVTFAIVFFSARAIHRRIGRHTPTIRLHGKYVFGWVMTTYAVGAGVLVPAVVDVRKRELIGPETLGMAFLFPGWLIGTIHGGIVLLIRREHAPPSDRAI